MKMVGKGLVLGVHSIDKAAFAPVFRKPEYYKKIFTNLRMLWNNPANSEHLRPGIFIPKPEA